MLAYTGRIYGIYGIRKAARNHFISGNPEERRKREDLIAKQKEVYRYKLIIGLSIALTLSSLAALIFGFN